MLDIDNLVPSYEMYNPARFIRQFHVWRLDQLKSKIITLDDKIQLPWNSVLHVLDNVNQFTLSDTPRLDTNRLVKQERFIKWIYHVRQLDYDDETPIQIDSQTGIPIFTDKPKQEDQSILLGDDDIKDIDEAATEAYLSQFIDFYGDEVISFEKLLTLKKHYIFLTAKMNQNIIKFRTENSSKYKPINELKAIPKKKEALVIINHNPLFRVMAKGNMKLFKKYQLILGSILNTCSRISNKSHYIQIPITNEMFMRNMFNRTDTILSNASVKRQDSFHYVFMMNVLNYINPKSTTSLFSMLPEEKRADINFFIQLNDKAIIYNMDDIYKLNEGNKAYIRVVNQFNMLALTGIEDLSNKKIIEENIKEEVVDAIEDNQPTNNKNKKTISSDKVTEIEVRPVVVQEIIPESEVILDMELESDIEKEIVEVNKKKATPVNTVTSQTVVKTIRPINSIPVDQMDISVPNTAVTKVDNVEKEIEVTKLLEDEKNFDSQIYSREIKEISFIEELDSQTDKLIGNLTNVTSKQKERLNNLSKVYKTFEIDGVKFEDILMDTTLKDLNENNLDFLKGEVPDESMLKSSVIDFDNVYMKNSFKRDLVSSLVSFSKQGMFLVDFEEKEYINELNREIEYKVTFEDTTGKKHVSKIKMPKVDEDGHCYVNGTYKIMKKQMVNKPICKISPNRVSLASNYNKSLVERNTAKAHSFRSYIERIISNSEYFDVSFNNIELNEPIAYEYSTLAKKFKTISFTNRFNDQSWILTFDYFNRFKLNSKYGDAIARVETELNSVFLGYDFKESEYSLFIDSDNKVALVNLKTNERFEHMCLMELIMTGLPSDKVPTKLSEWVDVKIQDKKHPVIFVLAYRFGLVNTLKYLNCNYTIYDKEETPRIKTKPTELVIDFNDKKLVIDRYPFSQFLIIAGLKNYDLKGYNLEQFDPIPGDSDGKDVYYDLLIDKNLSINYLKGIDNFFDLFVDPMTREILIDMNEPTNFRDLLIRATVMLTTEHAHEASSMQHHRARSYERFNAVVYNELSRKLADHRYRTGRGSKFTINPFIVYSRIIKDQAMIPVDNINPIQDIKEKSTFTFSGIGGRTSESFVVQDRIFPKDGLGIISEATPDSGNVAINANFTMDPSIINDKGMIKSKSIEDLQPTELLSSTALLMPCSTNDDCNYTVHLYSNI